jgi:glycosyltransferase involved in cell wall biosynthesis
MPINVAYLLEYSTVSGGERSLLCLLDHLDPRRFRPLLIVTPGGMLGGELQGRSLKTIPYSMTRQRRRRPFQEVAQELAPLLVENKVSLLHGNSLSCAEYTGFIGELASIPALAHVRDIQKLKSPRRARLSSNDHLIAVSEATRISLVDQGLSRHQVSTIWNGIGADFGVDQALTRPLFDGWEKGMRVIANIGQICLRKAQDLCLQAMIPLLQRDGHLHLLFVGQRFSQKQETIEFEAALHDIVRERGLEAQVHFSGYRADVAAVLQEVCLLAHSAHQEPLGRVLLEAQISGLPVVAMKVGGNGEVITDGETGFLVEKGDCDEFRSRIALLLDNATLRLSMSERARNQSLKRFDPESSSARVMALYERLLS